MTDALANVSSEVEEEVARRFPARDVPGVLGALSELAAPPAETAAWARTRSRVQLALIKLAAGDAAQFFRHLELAKLDWRDTLCAAGLENDDWPAVLRAAGYLVPR